MFQPPVTPAAQPFAPPQINPGGFNQNALNPGIVSPPQQQQPQRVQNVQEATEREKAPLPEEHRFLQMVLEDLRNQCSYVAGNPVSSNY